MTARRRRAVVREYDRLAGRYDERWASYTEATVRRTMTRLPLGSGGRLLDVACGTGALLEAVAAADSAMELSGVDLSPEMLAVASAKLGRRARLHAATAEALPFADGSFDIVVTCNAFHFFPDPEAGIAEMRRVLAPGGSLVVTDWCDDYLVCKLCDLVLRAVSPSHHRSYGRAECRDFLERGGIEVAELDRYKISWLWGLMTAVGYADGSAKHEESGFPPPAGPA